MLLWITADHVWLVLGAFAVGGFMLGVGLVVGTYVTRTLRRNMKDE